MAKQADDKRRRGMIDLKTKGTVRKTTVYMPVELAKRLGHYCIDREVDMSSAIGRAVEEMLAREEK